MTITEIFTYHSNQYTCGVTKFNSQLAEISGKPLKYFNPDVEKLNSPLVSISFKEISTNDLIKILQQLKKLKYFNLVIHSLNLQDSIELEIIQSAKNVICLNTEIFSTLLNYRKNLILGWCPAMINKNQSNLVKSQDFTIKNDFIFTFGMSKKFNESTFIEFINNLDQKNLELPIYVSAGLHEDSVFDSSFFNQINSLSIAIPNKVYFLGFLSDEIVSNLLSQCRLCLLFFEKGARENNSTLVSAINHNCQVVTNFDEHTPKWIKDLPNVYDSKSISIIPSKTVESKSEEKFTWNEFINEFKEQLFQ